MGRNVHPCLQCLGVIFSQQKCGRPRFVNFPSIGSVKHLRMCPLSPSLLQKLVHPTFFTWFKSTTISQTLATPQKNKNTYCKSPSNECEIINNTPGCKFFHYSRCSCHQLSEICCWNISNSTAPEIVTFHGSTSKDKPTCHT